MNEHDHGPWGSRQSSPAHLRRLTKPLPPVSTLSLFKQQLKVMTICGAAAGLLFHQFWEQPHKRKIVECMEAPDLQNLGPPLFAVKNISLSGFANGFEADLYDVRTQKLFMHIGGGSHEYANEIQHPNWLRSTRICYDYAFGRITRAEAQRRIRL